MLAAAKEEPLADALSCVAAAGPFLLAADLHARFATTERLSSMPSICGGTRKDPPALFAAPK